MLMWVLNLGFGATATADPVFTKEKYKGMVVNFGRLKRK